MTKLSDLARRLVNRKADDVTLLLEAADALRECEAVLRECEPRLYEPLRKRIRALLE